MLVVEAETPGLDSVSDVTIQHPHSADASVEGDADGAEGVVSCGGHLTSAPCPVLVCVKQVVSKSLN